LGLGSGSAESPLRGHGEIVRTEKGEGTSVECVGSLPYLVKGAGFRLLFKGDLRS